MKEDKDYSSPLPTEETAQKYIEAMERWREVTKDSIKTIDDITNTIVNTAQASKMCTIAMFKIKVLDSNFLTHWFWHRKMKKAEK